MPSTTTSTGWVAIRLSFRTYGVAVTNVLPYGSWPTPITAALVVEATVRLGGAVADGSDVWWSEGRPAEGGRTVIVRRRPDGSCEDVLAPPWNARTAVHEYGGGAWLVRDGVLWFSEWSDQRLYRVAPSQVPQPVTPPPIVARGDRYADGDLSPDGAWLACVRERHHGDGTEAANEIVSLAAGGGEPDVIVAGPDFVASPRWSHDGQALCWIEWDHPNMPWDSTRLLVRRDGADVVVAGQTGDSVLQPVWEPDGSLLFLSDRTGWWNLYRWNGRDVETVIEIDGEIGEPQWVFGGRRFARAEDGRIVFGYWRDGVDHLAVRAPDGAIETLDLPYTEYAGVSVDGDRIGCIAASPAAEAAVVEITLDGTAVSGVDVLRPPRQLDLEAAFAPAPEAIDFPTSGGQRSHALFYAPAHPTAAGPPGEAPPLLVTVHGGPTSAARPTLQLDIRFWTSRGIGVVDVNYRGSTGYGRTYRRALNGEWGVLDVDDCEAAARHLAESGRADPNRLLIEGGSAGGFTTLACLAFRDTFAAGCSCYGVADLEALARDTHKFESRYLDTLVGPYPARRDLYEARSPIHHLDGFDRPLIVEQGLEDQIVPPSQSEMIVDALRRKGVPVAYLTFPGEQHGFRKAETIVAALQAELSFFAQMCGFELPPDEGIEPIVIENLGGHAA
jgi:dipeptidyl aminopeptidase/acylaminoacyl peptidase